MLSKTGQAEAQPSEVKLLDTDGWLTRNEASDMLRCSLQTLKNYESRELLHPRQGLRKDRTEVERMMLVYNPKELAALPTKKPGGPREALREPGEQAARIFELLKAGKALDEIVIELRETPERIDQLNEHWLDQTKARHVISPEAKKKLVEILGPFATVTDLVELVTSRIAADKPTGSDKENDAPGVVLLKMLTDPRTSQLITELITTTPNGRSVLLKMSTHSSALADAFAKLIAKLS